MAMNTDKFISVSLWIDITYDQWGIFKENRINMESYNQKDTREICGKHNVKGSRDNLTLTGYTEGKRRSENGNSPA